MSRASTRAVEPVSTGARRNAVPADGRRSERLRLQREVLRESRTSGHRDLLVQSLIAGIGHAKRVCPRGHLQ